MTDLSGYSTEDLLAMLESPAKPTKDLSSYSTEDLLAMKDQVSYASRPLSDGEAAAAVPIKVLNAMTFGLGDEITAGGSSLIDKVTKGGDLSDLYDSRLEQARGLEQRYSEQRPIMGPALELAGGIKTLGGIGKKALTSPTMVGKMARGAVAGAGFGGLFGFNEGEGGLENRTSNARFGAGIGAGIGAGMGAGGYLGGKALKTETANNIKNYLQKLIKEQKGVFGKFARSSSGVKPSQREVIRLLDDASDDSIIKAGKRIAIAEKQGKPLTIFEALDIDEGYATAKAVRSSQGGSTPAGEFLQKRAKGNTGRLRQTLEQISPEDDIYTGSKLLKEGAEEIGDALKETRAGATGPLYKKAAQEMGDIQTNKVRDVIKHPLVDPLIKQARRTFADEIPKDASNYNYKVLKFVKEELSDKYSAAKRTGNNNLARKYSELGSKLTAEIDNASPLYGSASKEYAKHSREIERVIGGKYAGKRTVGILQDILSANDEVAGSASTKLLSKSPTQMKKVMEVFKRHGDLDKLRAGVRAGLQKHVDNAKTGLLKEGGGDIVNRILPSDVAVDNLEILLGKKQARKLLSELEVEALIFKGQKEIGTTVKGIGSSTQITQNRTKTIAGRIKNGWFKKKQTVEALADKLLPSENEEVSRSLAKELFKPASTEEYNRLLKFKNQFDAYRKSINQGVAVAEGVGKHQGALEATRPKNEKGIFTPAAALTTTGATGAASQLFGGQKQKNSLFGDSKVKYSKSAEDLIKEQESLVLETYDDGGGVNTIGYGHTGAGVKKGKITKAEAEQLFKKDVSEAEKAIKALVKTNLTQNQHDALVSFVYNIGAGQFEDSTLLKKINAGDFEGAAEEFPRWRYDNGKELRGLVKRREKEKNLFLA